MIGVETAGALKNVIAIAVGICDGMDGGHNARAALMTRGLTEMTRIGVAQGADAETFLGLAGIGDLHLAATATSAIDRGTTYTVIPWQMGVVAKLMRLLPDAVYDRLARNAPRKPRKTG